MPTVAEILAGIDSFVTPAKRRVVDMLMNPRAAMAQTAGRLSDDSNAALRDLNTQADANMLRAQGSVMADLPQYRQAEDSSRQRIVNMLMNFAPVGATVYHGSPHKFDKFDASKIGTGEGAQAYGHGIYTAEAEKVAAEYRKSLSNLYGIPTKVDGGGESIPIPQWLGNKINSEGIDAAIKEWTDRAAQQREAMKTSLQPWNHETNLLRFEKELEQMRKMKAANQATVADPGYLYKVDLPDEAIAKMLDWDKPLSQQSDAIYNAFRKAYQDKHVTADPNSPTGTLMLQLQKSLGANGATEYLRAQGIPGIRYLDGGSRSAGQGTSNYVVFPGNEGLLNILERNGKPIK